MLTIVARQKSEAAGQEFDDEAFAPMRDAFADQVEQESTALFATGRGWDDGLIDPRDTRAALTMGLSAVHSAPVEGAHDYGVWRM